MTLYKGRSRFEGFSVKVGMSFSKAGLSPNQWTLLSLLLVFVALWFLLQARFVEAAIVFLVSSFLDLVDGSVARVTGRVSRLGAYLDTMVDRYVEGIIIAGLLFVSLPAFLLPAAAWLLLYLFGAFMTTYAKAAAFEKGLVEQELKGGLLERAERLIILFLGLLLASLQPLYLVYVVAVLAVLSHVTALQRMAAAIRRREKA